MSASAALWVKEVRPLSDDDIAERDALYADLALTLGSKTLATLQAQGALLTLKEALALARAS
jgi:hypothetical protein